MFPVTCMKRGLEIEMLTRCTLVSPFAFWELHVSNKDTGKDLKSENVCSLKKTLDLGKFLHGNLQIAFPSPM